MLPLVETSPGCWEADCKKAAPVLAPLLSLGRRMVATKSEGTYSLAPADTAAGGLELRTMALEPELFEASAMRVGDKDLLAMKVTELREELSARGEAVSGNKAWLRRRLHAAIVREHLADAAAADSV